MRLPDLPAVSDALAILSLRLIEMSSDAVALGQGVLQKGVQPFGAGHRFL
jgi:hypothetical protein